MLQCLEQCQACSRLWIHVTKPERPRLRHTGKHLRYCTKLWLSKRYKSRLCVFRGELGRQSNSGCDTRVSYSRLSVISRANMTKGLKVEGVEGSSVFRRVDWRGVNLEMWGGSHQGYLWKNDKPSGALSISLSDHRLRYPDGLQWFDFINFPLTKQHLFSRNDTCQFEFCSCPG